MAFPTLGGNDKLITGYLWMINGLVDGEMGLVSHFRIMALLSSIPLARNALNWVTFAVQHDHLVSGESWVVIALYHFTLVNLLKHIGFFFNP